MTIFEDYLFNEVFVSDLNLFPREHGIENSTYD